ncbi:hypothetical protein L6Q96_21730 [Candidatus Binatia bacterium]|nr:hypothetical protein [Candidatus Binatia bacterium]
MPVIDRGVYLFATTPDNVIAANWYRTRPQTAEPAWRGWTPVLGLDTDTAPATATFNECVILIAKGLDGHIYMNVMKDPYWNDFCGF